IDGRKYPPELAGDLYPEGIPIYAEEELPHLIKDLDVDECVFSYSDLHYEKVMGISAIVNAAGADFTLLGSKHTMVKAQSLSFPSVPSEQEQVKAKLLEK